MTARVGLAGRLFAGQALVGATGVAVLWLVAVVVGPSQFRSHLDRTGMHLPPQVSDHAEQAFRDATTLSLAAALAAGTLASVLVSVWLTRRLSRSVATVAEASTALAAGHLETRLADPGLGPEFTRLAAAYNAMAERLGAVESTRRRLLADLAHELRTPLAVLDAHLEGIQDGMATADAGTLDVMRSQTRRLTRLAEDVAAVSRAEEGDLRLDLSPTAAAGACRAALAACRPQADDARVRLLEELDEDLVLAVDPQRLAQILGNLLANAVRHTPTGGVVTLRCARDGESGLLEVRDTGEGIAAAHLEHVFERFYRADNARDRAHGGSGIGLAIVKALVEAQQGSVSAASAGPGTGATFTVRLPLWPNGRTATGEGSAGSPR